MKNILIFSKSRLITYVITLKLLFNCIIMDCKLIVHFRDNPDFFSSWMCNNVVQCTV